MRSTGWAKLSDVADSLYDAAVDMLDLGMRHVPVLDERGRPLGMVSVRDLLRPLLTATLDGSH